MTGRAPVDESQDCAGAGTRHPAPEFERKVARLRKEHAMKMKTFVAAGVALLALGIGPAIAGPCTTEIDSVAKTLAAKDAGAGPTAGASGTAQPPTSPSPQHPPAAIMGQETQGKATSPEDVRRQTEGRPTTTQQGTTGADAGAGSAMGASSALDRARALDQQGREAECMEAVGEAKQFARP
jgi:hypothetical protein